MGRLQASAVMENMMAVMRLINSLAPSDHTPGRPVSVTRMAKTLGIEPERVRDSIRMLNECGAALEDDAGGVIAPYYIDFDEKTDLVTPYRMDIAIDRTIGLSPREARALLTMFDIAGISDDDPLVKKIAGAMPRLTAKMVEGMETSGATPAQTGMLLQINDAITAHSPVRISYQGVRDREARTRYVIPQRLTYDLDESSWYLYGWCIDADGWRTFRLDRIQTMAPVTSDDVDFVMLMPQTATSNASRRLLKSDDGEADASPLDERLKEAETATLAVHDPKTVYETPEWRGLRRVDDPDERDMLRLTNQDQARGGYVATIPWIDESPWLVRKIVSTLGGVEVIRPTRLRSAVVQEAQRLLQLLSEEIPDNKEQKA